MVADDCSKEHAVTMKESLNIKVRLIKIEDVEEMATYWQDKGGSANEGGAFFS